eukprot:scaffold24345_cov64-Attheya_sp.AAC.3
MPESHKAERRRVMKANREAGIGDETGRIVREKEPPKMMSCTTCKLEFRCTKTNTELKKHAEGKHAKANYEDCFPGAEAIRTAALGNTEKEGKSDKKGTELTKAQRKAKAANNMDDLLSDGLSAAPKKKFGKK